MREISHHIALSTFRHPLIVKMMDVEFLPEGLALIMEFREGVQTLDRLQEAHGGRLPHSVARQLFQQLMIALEFCHRLGLSNRDCKITDLLVHVDSATGDVRLQLTDFSFAKDSDQDADSNPMSQHGSALFTAPEVITASHAVRYSGSKADIYSAGVVLCTLLFGCHPHLAQADLDRPPAEQVLQIMANAVQGRIVVSPEEATAQPEAFQLMCAMLRLDPDARPDCTAVLQHPWIRTGLAPYPELSELNDALLSDERLRQESQQAGKAARQRVAGLMERLFEECARVRLVGRGAGESVESVGESGAAAEAESRAGSSWSTGSGAGLGPGAGADEGAGADAGAGEGAGAGAGAAYGERESTAGGPAGWRG